MIEFVGFSKKYNGARDFSVQNVNLTARRGCITGLLGVNGAGKSTLLKAVCALHYATEGNVLVSGDDEGSPVDVQKNPHAALQLVGYMPEDASLPENLYAAEYLYGVLGMARPSFTEDEKMNRVREVLRECLIQDASEKKIRALSKGYRQRVLLCAALVAEPGNVILDEPTNGLDPAQIIQFRSIVKKIAETRTVLLSTHIMQEVEALCSQIYILHERTIAAAGSPAFLKAQFGADSIENVFLKVST